MPPSQQTDVEIRRYNSFTDYDHVWMLLVQTKLYPDVNGPAWVAVTPAGYIVGFIDYEIKTSERWPRLQEIFIYALAVSPTWRRKGIGARLKDKVCGMHPGLHATLQKKPVTENSGAAKSREFWHEQGFKTDSDNRDMMRMRSSRPVRRRRWRSPALS